MRRNIFSRMTLSAWKKDIFGTIIFSCFISITVMLFSLSILLFSNLTGAIDCLIDISKTPDFLQMHTGYVDITKLENFAKARNDIEDWKVCNFLNLENGQLFLGEKSLKDSTQDNGLCVQNDGFDLLLNLDNQIPKVDVGTVWVPACYQKKYDVNVGDKFRIGKETLIVAGFIRDSQMNSMMASSKRFLVAEEDYERLQNYGSEEYLIEYLLKPQADIGAFQNAYENAGLPGNGPSITKPLIRMINAMSDGIMILILLLVSLLVLLISLVCIRFMLITKIEEEKNEIGLLKAIGISKHRIRGIFIRRYIFLTGSGTVAGFVASMFLSRPLSEQMRRLYGTTDNGMVVILLSFLGAILLSAVIMLYLFRLLKKLNEMTAIQALSGKCDRSGKRAGMICISFVAAIAVFLMIVPANLYNTMSSNQFVTYMGIGDSQIRMDIRQTDDIQGKQEMLRSKLEEDDRVKQYGFFQTSQVTSQLLSGEINNLLVEQGNHTIFPVSYGKGEAPVNEGEIALSYLLAKDLNLDVGDIIKLKPGNEYEEYVVCGIYSDITNGGKTAKVTTFLHDIKPSVVWSIVYVTLNTKISLEDWILDYQIECVEAVDISRYVQGTYGQTLAQIHRVSIMVKLVAAIIITLVIALFLRLLISKERMHISIKKSLGFRTVDIRKAYLARSAIYFLPGILAGIIIGNIAGEQLCGIALRSLGADGFRFVINIWENICIIPVFTLVVGVFAMLIGTREINNITPVECLRGRE